MDVHTSCRQTLSHRFKLEKYRLQKLKRAFSSIQACVSDTASEQTKYNFSIGDIS